MISRSPKFRPVCVCACEHPLHVLRADLPYLPGERPKHRSHEHLGDADGVPALIDQDVIRLHLPEEVDKEFVVVVVFWTRHCLGNDGY